MPTPLKEKLFKNNGPNRPCLSVSFIYDIFFSLSVNIDPFPIPYRADPPERGALRKMGQIWRRLSKKLHMSFFGLQRKVSPLHYCFPCVWCSLELIVRSDVDRLFAEILFLWPLKETHHKSHQFAIVAGTSDLMSRPGKAGGAVSLLKAISVDWALAQNTSIFETTSHRVTTYHVSADPPCWRCSCSLKSAS